MTTLSADGRVEVGVLHSECCVPSLCSIDLCCTLIPSFIGLLPSGPLWDEDKVRTLEKYRQECGQVYCVEDSTCTNMVDYTVYTAKKFYDFIKNGLWPMIRESNPATAYTTLDMWLERYGWQDCFGTACRSPALGELTPYEVPGECGPVFCAPEAPEELATLVKRGVVLALKRASMGVIKNLDGINFIIEPLGAMLVPYIDDCTVDPDDGTTACPIVFDLKSIIPTQKRWVEIACPVTDEQLEQADEDVSLFYGVDPCKNPGLPVEIWPTILAAECIVRSLLPQNSRIQINRKC